MRRNKKMRIYVPGWPSSLELIKGWVIARNRKKTNPKEI